MNSLKKFQCLNALHLKLLAMAFMFCDHLWATLVSDAQWLNSIGRLAFPIFAFQIVEGYVHTHDFKRYLKRMLVFALISEIPFNLMTEAGILNPFHQNVMFTFFIALLLMRLLDFAREKSFWLYLAAIPAVAFLGYLLGNITFVDYFGSGILVVLLFYVFRDVKFGWIGILLGMLYISGSLISGIMFDFELFGRTISFHQQSLAVLALIPIALYNGKQGPHSKTIQYACYAFYPAHMLILSLIAFYVTR